MPAKTKQEKEVLYIGDKVSGLRYCGIINRIFENHTEVILKGGWKYINKMMDIANTVMGSKEYTINCKLEQFKGREGKMINARGIYILLKR